jgi:hypothetical protein
MEKWYDGFTLYVPDPDDPAGEWIGVLWGSPEEIPCPFELLVRYSERGELLCTGLRIGEGCDFRPKSNISRRMLVNVPLGAVLQYIHEHRDSPEIQPEIRHRLANSLPFELVLPPGGLWARPGPKGHPDKVYIEAAEAFAREAVPGSNAEVYQRLARERGRDESTFRRHVKKGWQLRRNLKPEGIRTRRTTQREE